MILDVGCGNRPRGTVNIDLYLGPTEHTEEPIQLHKTPNLVHATAEALPFRDKSFDLVFSDNLLEHLSDPLAALREFLRVGRRVRAIVPHRFSPGAHRSIHRAYLDRPWFEEAFRRLGVTDARVRLIKFNYWRTRTTFTRRKVGRAAGSLRVELVLGYILSAVANVWVEAVGANPHRQDSWGQAERAQIPP